MAGAFRPQVQQPRSGELYSAWRDTSPQMRNRILAEPALFLKARREIDKSKPETEPASSVLLRDLDMVSAIARRASRRWRASRRPDG